ncbi:hypothetical protein COLO4_02458 [Corchorus olitorius]|uniref:Uncharacterized protein n=1 Tax=Corchorus olitorius TaxID=93759 RepID=A0A1R3L146_9ROSI|nr:hypothetical protein COLO4_03211 [Corchorus olitorius]OMP12440.1 hypothetical protein COLO4_03210 [Corchorus olitorius]OMP12998.1 hypothetical protein COLO4_02458 [Corchorus olitorius]
MAQPVLFEKPEVRIRISYCDNVFRGSCKGIGVPGDGEEDPLDRSELHNIRESHSRNL